MSETQTAAPLDLVSARELCAKATAGPWKTDDQQWRLLHADGYDLLEVADKWNDPTPEFLDQSNAQFCAQARTLLPQALDEIERLQQKVDYLTSAMRISAGYKAEGVK